jgi:class 3 adenylate cyclase
MQATHSTYNYLDSVERINEILESSENNYEEKKSIPDRNLLTFTNGYSVSAAALCVDIRNSTSLSDKYKRPKLAKIYRCYISEVVAAIKGDENVNEIYIEGDGIWAVFDTPYQPGINEVFSTGARISSLIDILNFRFSKNDISPIEVGIGMTYGTALYIKAGYKGSGINEVVWLGKLVSEAHELCSYGNKTYYDYEIMVSNVFYNNLNDHNKKLLSYNSQRNCYHGNVIHTVMNNWLNEQKNK